MITSKEEFDAEIKKALAPLVEAVKEAQKEALDKLTDTVGVNSAYYQPEAGLRSLGEEAENFFNLTGTDLKQVKRAIEKIKAIGFLQGNACGPGELLFVGENKDGKVVTAPRPVVVVVGEPDISKELLRLRIEKSLPDCMVIFPGVDVEELGQTLVNFGSATESVSDKLQKVADELARADKKLTKQIPHGIPWDKKRDFKRRK